MIESVLCKKVDIFLFLILIGYYKIKTRKLRGLKRRLYSVHPVWRTRKLYGSHDNLVEKLRKYPEIFKNYCRLTIEEYDELLQRVKPRLTKTSNRGCLPAGLRLMITLRYLAAGSSMKSMSYEYRVEKSTKSKVIRECCEVIWDCLVGEFMRVKTASDWLDVASDFYNLWNFPNCVGCIDGKHVNIRCPTFSVVLLGVCDSMLRFMYVDIGAYGTESDGGIFQQSVFGQHFMNNELDFPPEQALPKSADGKKFPFFFIGDAAFPLHKNMLKPYGGTCLTDEQKTFNYRLSRARNCIERAFGVLVSRWRILFTTINAAPSTVDSIVKATVVLHNYIITKRPKTYSEKSSKHIEVLNKCTGLQQKSSCNKRLGTRNATQESYKLRDEISSYFMHNDVLE